MARAVLTRRAAPAALALALVGLVSGCRSSREAVGPPEVERLRSENVTLRRDLDAALADLERVQGRVDELEAALDAEAENGSGQRGETVALLPTDIFFDSGSAQLTPQGARGLVEVAERLREEFAGRTIRIEGYTDSNPIGPNLEALYPSNWELSAARAAMVARHLQWTHRFDGAEMEVVGLGQYHPLGDNATPEGREENRRVRIAVMVD